MVYTTVSIIALLISMIMLILLDSGFFFIYVLSFGLSFETPVIMVNKNIYKINI